MNNKSIVDKAISALAVIVLYTASTASTLANQNDEVILYLNDPLGTAVAAYDENGNVCWEEAHTPYGDKTVMEDSFNRRGCGVVTEERGFTGHSEDFETDLVYMQQRYYDPTIGRFLSTDPIGPIAGISESTNRYSYGRNNPYRYADPDGRWAEDLIVGVPSLAIGIVSFGANALAGNFGGAAFDAIGIVADVGAILTPGVPGGAGLSIKAGRAANAATDANKLDNVPNSAQRPSSFRKKTVEDSWDNAAPGSKPNTKKCPTCDNDVEGNPYLGEKRNGPNGWDNDHQPKWKDRDLTGMNRKQVLDEYNKDTQLRCKSCNRADN